MNERFKFRVWNKQSNSYTKEKIFYINEFGSLFKYKKSNSTVYINADSPYVIGFCGDNYIVEQYTGLKDKNGKLIYEHDLIKISGFDRIFQVVWLEEPACWGLKHQKDTSALCFMQGAEKEIIGNIHENKDLLEK